MIQDNSPLKTIYINKCKELCITFDELDLEWLTVQINSHIKDEDLYNIEIEEISNNSASTSDEIVLNAEIKFDDIFDDIMIVYHFVITFKFGYFDFNDNGKDIPYTCDLEMNSLQPYDGGQIFYLENLFECYINEMFNIKDKMLEYKFNEYKSWCNRDTYEGFCNRVNRHNKKED